MPATVPEWTIQAVLDLPADGNRYELLEGELAVTPAPTFGHQRAVFELQRRLHEYVATHNLGWAMASPADIVLSPNTLVQPDVLVVPRRGETPPKQWSEVSALLIAAEVISPSTAKRDRETKLRLYQRFGVPMYLAVDVAARRIDVWTPEAKGPARVDSTLAWQPHPALPELVLDLPALFDDIAR